MNVLEDSFVDRVAEVMRTSNDTAIHINDALRYNGYEVHVGVAAVSAKVVIAELRDASGTKSACLDSLVLAPYVIGDVNDSSSHIVRGVALWRKADLTGEGIGSSS